MSIHRPVRACASVVLVVAGAFVAFAQSGRPAADLDPTSHSRLPYLKRADLDERAQKIYDTLPGRGQDGVLRGPLAFAAYNPGVAQALFALHNAAVDEGTLDARTRELAILVACRETNYSLEWNAHEQLGLKSGLDAKLIAVVHDNAPLSGLADKDAMVIRFGRQLFHDHKVDSPTFAKAVELLGKRGVMDMVAVMNTYAVSGFYAIAVDEHMPAGRPELKGSGR